MRILKSTALLALTLLSIVTSPVSCDLAGTAAGVDIGVVD